MNIINVIEKLNKAKCSIHPESKNNTYIWRVVKGKTEIVFTCFPGSDEIYSVKINPTNDQLAYPNVYATHWSNQLYISNIKD